MRKVGHADPDASAGDADGAHREAHAILLAARTCLIAERGVDHFAMALATGSIVAAVRFSLVDGS